jgi:tetratricopeptide (TPR) repeat protein
LRELRDGGSGRHSTTYGNAACGIRARRKEAAGSGNCFPLGSGVCGVGRFLSVVEQPPGTERPHRGAFLDRGILFATRGDFELAIEEFTEAIQLDGRLASAYTLRGRSYLAGALHVLKIKENFRDFIAITEDGKNIIPKKRAGFDKAIADYTQSINLDPKLAVAYRDRGDYDQAIKGLQPSYQAQPELRGGL